MFEAVQIGRARMQYDALTPEERVEADRVIYSIELNPWVDGVLKFPFLVPPLMVTLYGDDRWQITFRVVDDRFVEIYAIGRVES